MTAPTVERLASALRLDSGEPVLVLYGPGTGDSFVCTDYQQRDCNGALWHLLKAAGFTRIAFSSFSEPLYFLDEESRALSVTGARARAGRGRMTQITGPQGDRVQFSAEARANAGAPSGGGSILPSYGLQTLDAYLKQDRIPTAVVIERAEDYLAHMTPRDQLADRIGNWVQGRAGTNRNICIFVFTVDTMDRVVEQVTDLRLFNTFAEYVRRRAGNQPNSAGGFVSMPGPAELERLLDLARVRHGLTVRNWPEYQKLPGKMDGSEPTLASTWLAKMAALGTGTELSADRLMRSSVKSTSTAQEQLDALVGLENVKSHITRLRAYARVQAERAKAGMNTGEDRSNHMIFSGNPGTGKTTVARIVGQLYQEIGLLRRGHLVEVDTSDLIAGYVGQTAIKTSEVIDSALDGVLFLDEAYRLTERDRGGFAGEALDLILTRMENDRDRLLVIAAGYTGKMRDFVAANPGLRRRFPDQNVIEFLDYPPGQLFEILVGFLAAKGHTIDPAMMKLLRRIVEALYAKRDEASFGNAGEMRNLAQAIDEHWASRVDRLSGTMGLEAAVKQPLLPEDIPAKYRDLAP